jgi:hypothetical protein
VKIQRTVFHFEILHPADTPITDLATAIAEASDGIAVGAESMILTEPVSADLVDAKLIELGNDGTFFDGFEEITN